MEINHKRKVPPGYSHWGFKAEPHTCHLTNWATPLSFNVFFKNLCSRHRCLCDNKMRLTQTVRCTGQAVGPTGCCSSRLVGSSTQVRGPHPCDSQASQPLPVSILHLSTPQHSRTWKLPRDAALLERLDPALQSLA